MIIDCHTHLSIMSEGETFDIAARKMQDLMAKNNLDGAIVIADNVLNDSCANTDTLLEIFKDSQNIWIVGSTNPFEPESRIEKFDQLLEVRKIVGMKIFPGHDKVYVDDQKYLADVNLCKKYGVPLMIHTGVNIGDLEAAKYNDPGKIADLALKYPEVSFIICHYFFPEIEYCYQKLARLSNVYFDTSGLADEEVLEMSGGLPKMKEILERTLATRAGSVLFGSNSPMCDQSKHLELVNGLLLSEVERAGVLGGVARKVFGV